MTNPLASLQADLEAAARSGGEHAGHVGVEAGVAHNDSAARALFNTDTVHAQFTSELDANVTASQPYGVSPYGPSLPGIDGTADIMADATVHAAAAATLPDRR